MTPEKAVELLKANEETKVVAIYNSVKRAAIKALEKQIPKNPIITDWINCPSCNWGLTLIKGTKYCPKCGQALDWSDVQNDNG